MLYWSTLLVNIIVTNPVSDCLYFLRSILCAVSLYSQACTVWFALCAFIKFLQSANELSEWGFQECIVESDNGAFGAVLPKSEYYALFDYALFTSFFTVLLRNLPRNYPSNNVYSLFPFTAPTAVKDTLANKPHICKLYDWDRPRSGDVKYLE